MNNVVIVSACRTPIGRFLGSLKDLTGDKLAECAIRGVLAESECSVSDVEEVYMGQCITAGQGSHFLKKAALLAGVPSSVPCTLVNKRCASGLKAIIIAAQAIKCGDRNIMIAGGLESMSNVPYYLKRTHSHRGHLQLQDSLFIDACTDTIYNTGPVGVIMEKCAQRDGISREEQDDYAEQSYRLVQQAWKQGLFNKEIIPVNVPNKEAGHIVVTQDEECNRSNLDRLRNLPPAFSENGTITAGNSSFIGDGAAALLLTSEQAAINKSLQPIARIVGYSDAGVDPTDIPTAVILSIQQLLDRYEVSKDDIAMWEINETFSSVVIKTMRTFDIDPELVNKHGGAVSIGHPLGMTGARITAHLAHCLGPNQLGIASVVNGGGGASAILLQGL